WFLAPVTARAVASATDLPWWVESPTVSPQESGPGGYCATEPWWVDAPLPVVPTPPPVCVPSPRRDSTDRWVIRTSLLAGGLCLLGAAVGVGYLALRGDRSAEPSLAQAATRSQSPSVVPKIAAPPAGELAQEPAPIKPVAPVKDQLPDPADPP